MLFLLIVGVTLRLINGQRNYQIEDIPIENFSLEREDLQNGAVDLELMPRFQRSFPTSSEDPKDYFFSRPFYDENNYDGVRDIPKPGGFGLYLGENEERSGIRRRREAVESDVKQDGKIKSLVRRLGKPLELAVINTENITEKPEDIGTEVPVTDEAISETSNFLINDFIRFKRGTPTEKVADDVTKIKDLMRKIDDENKSKTNTSEVDPNSMVEEVPQPYTEKLVMEPRGEEQEPARGTRGATKEQWVKQAYPVRRNDVDDSSSASVERGDGARAPRVHFVTSESAFRPEYNRYDREARSRNLNKEVAWNLNKDPYRDMDYYQPRYTRNYIPPTYPSVRNERYYNYDAREPPYDDYRSRSRYYDFPERSYDTHNNYSGSKGRQRRIIYYASLPEVTRTPPRADLRDRYDYRDRYEDRFFYPDPSYQLRKPYPKSRYNENDNRKPPNPLQVSTDVSVREVKKNPERRIYSEVDRNRYSQTAAYQNERM